jgi:hypothetical protein
MPGVITEVSRIAAPGVISSHREARERAVRCRRGAASQSRGRFTIFPADEVVVVTRPDEEATWLEDGSSEAIAQRLDGLKVTHLVVSDND